MSVPPHGKELLGALREQEVKLNEPVEVAHYVYFARRGDARRIEKQLRASGFQLERKRSATGDKWLILARHRVVLDEESYGRLAAFFQGVLAKVNGGEYDGLEVEIRRSPSHPE